MTDSPDLTTRKTFSSATSLALVNNVMNYQQQRSQGGSPVASARLLLPPEGRQMVLKVPVKLCCRSFALAAHPLQFKNISGNTAYFTCYTAV